MGPDMQLLRHVPSPEAKGMASFGDGEPFPKNPKNAGTWEIVSNHQKSFCHSDFMRHDNNKA